MMKLNIPAIAENDSPIMPAVKAEVKNSTLLIAKSASKQMLHLMDKQQNPALKLRIQIRGGGCSGFQYKFELTDLSKPDDFVWQQDGTTFLVDPLSQVMLDGAEIEYFTSPMESGFRLQNPHAKSNCGCGVSFAVK